MLSVHFSGDVILPFFLNRKHNLPLERVELISLSVFPRVFFVRKPTHFLAGNAALFLPHFHEPPILKSIDNLHCIQNIDESFHIGV